MTPQTNEWEDRMSSVDVVVPCYNYGRYLRQCVESVLAQEGVAVRVLVIDDCSTDDTPEVGRALAAEDARVEYRRHETNHGHIATYNEGFKWATGRATLLLSADDMLTAGALYRASVQLDLHPDVGLVFGRQLSMKDGFPPRKPNQKPDFQIIDGIELIRTMCGSGSNPVDTPTAVVRTTTLHEVGEYSRALPHTADMEFWLRVAACSRIVILSADQAYKREHGQNMEFQFITRMERDLSQRWEAFDAFFAREESRIQDVAQLRLTARQALADLAFWAGSEAFDRGDRGHCEVLLDLAKRLNPNLTVKKCWSRLTWKRRLGVRAWRALRPLIERVRVEVGRS
jgi:glycosyltransferase involved in cell wall biosynthesis